MKRCGYPKWAVDKRPGKTEDQKKSSKEKEYEAYTVIPYVRGTSEKIAQALRKHDVSTVHKPSRTIKNMLCNMKEKHHELDKVNAIYEVECREHHVKYVGETMRPLKMRAMEHRVVNSKEAKKSHTLGWRKKDENEEKEKEKDESIRRSNRLGEKERKDYKQMNEGERIVMSEGTTEPAKHAYNYQTEHSEESMTIKAIGYEPNLRRRQV